MRATKNPSFRLLNGLIICLDAKIDVLFQLVDVSSSEKLKQAL